MDNLSLNKGFRSVKAFFAEKNNTMILLLSVNFVLLVCIMWLVVYIYLEITDKIDHRYFNTTKTLSRIHNVKVDTYDGDLIRELTTEEQIFRKKNKRWHLRYLFK